MRRILLALVCLAAVACNDSRTPPQATDAAGSSSAAPDTLGQRFSDRPGEHGFERAGPPVELGIDAAATARAGGDPRLAAIQATALSAGGYVEGRLTTWKDDAHGAQLLVSVVELESAADALGLLEFDRLASVNSGTPYDVSGLDDEVAFTVGGNVHVSFARDDRVWSLVFTLAAPDHAQVDAIVLAQAETG